MASGVGAFGGTSQCYRFWLGFTECRLSASNPTLCLLEQADYMECLHRDKLKRRIANKLVEAKRQHDEAANPKKESHGGGHH
jgi:hypothetical protein